MNQHLEHAIRIYDNRGEQFANLLSWHSLHGVVVIDADCVFLAYWCDHTDLMQPVSRGDASTVFVSYFSGDWRGLGRYADVEFIAYERLRSQGRHMLSKTSRLLGKLNKTKTWDHQTK